MTINVYIVRAEAENGKTIDKYEAVLFRTWNTFRIEKPGFRASFYSIFYLH